MTLPQRTRLRLPQVRLTQLLPAIRLHLTQLALPERQERPRLRTTLVALPERQEPLRLHLTQVVLLERQERPRPRTTLVALLERQERPRPRTTLVAVLLTLLLRVTQPRSTRVAQQAQVEAQLQVGLPHSEQAVEHLAEQPKALVILLRGQHIGLALTDSQVRVATLLLIAVAQVTSGESWVTTPSPIFTGMVER